MDEQSARVRLVRTPNGQRLDIPLALMMSGDEVILRGDSARLVVEPVARPSILAVLAGLDTLDEEWLDIADPHPEGVRL